MEFTTSVKSITGSMASKSWKRLLYQYCKFGSNYFPVSTVIITCMILHRNCIAFSQVRSYKEVTAFFDKFAVKLEVFSP